MTPAAVGDEFPRIGALSPVFLELGDIGFRVVPDSGPVDQQFRVTRDEALYLLAWLQDALGGEIL